MNKYGKLSNNIKYNISQDDNCDGVYVAVSVNIGSLNNPKDYQGLAHFLEHMLFLGSEKYPDENHFDKIVKGYGGNLNAYTGYYETVYHYYIYPQYLEKTLDVLANFFIKPLFNKDAVMREINAINSEHLKNINSDVWFTRQVVNSITKNDAVVNTFITGNLETLNKPDIREKMIDFYNKFYCSDNITVSITSSGKISTTEKIFKKCFNQIPNKQCHPKVDIVKPFFNNYNNEYQIIPNNGSTDNMIVYVWELPQYDYFLKNKINFVLSEVLDSTNIDSLQTFLINAGLIKDLGSVYFDEGFFYLFVNTNKFDKTSINIINNHIKHYFNNMNKFNWNDLLHFYKNKYDILVNTNFYSDYEDRNIDMANNLHYYTNYIFGDKVIHEINLDNMNEILEMLQFNKCNIFYKSKTILFDNTKFITEIHYKVKYGKLLSSLLQHKDVDIQFKYDLDDFFYKDIPHKIKGLKLYKPKEIKKRVYFGNTSKYKEPKVYGKIILCHHSLSDTIENDILTRLAYQSINHYLSQHFNEANEIGYNCYFSFNSTFSSLYLNINGLNSMYSIFIEQCLDYIKKIKIENNIISLNINSMIESLENTDSASPLALSKHLIKVKLNNYYYKYTKLLEYIKVVDIDELILKVKNRIKYIQNFKNLSATSFFYGNYKKPLVLLEDNHKFKRCSLPTTNVMTDIDVKHPNRNEKNNLVMYMFNGKINDEYKRLAMFLCIMLMMGHHSYDYLRTKKQLGYIAGSSLFKNLKESYLLLRVQSEKEVDIVSQEMDTFIEMFKTNLQKLTDDEFTQTKQSGLDTLLKKNTEIETEFVRYFGEIQLQEYVYDKHELIAKQLKKIKKQDLYNYFISITKSYNKVIIRKN